MKPGPISPKLQIAMHILHKADARPVKDLCKELKIPRATAYRYADRLVELSMFLSRKFDYRERLSALEQKNTQLLNRIADLEVELTRNGLPLPSKSPDDYEDEDPVD